MKFWTSSGASEPSCPSSYSVDWMPALLWASLKVTAFDSLGHSSLSQVRPILRTLLTLSFPSGGEPDRKGKSDSRKTPLPINPVALYATPMARPALVMLSGNPVPFPPRGQRRETSWSLCISIQGWPPLRCREAAPAFCSHPSPCPSCLFAQQALHRAQPLNRPSYRLPHRQHGDWDSGRAGWCGEH